jgi:hypothetical protein
MITTAKLTLLLNKLMLIKLPYMFLIIEYILSKKLFNGRFKDVLSSETKTETELLPWKMN